MNPTRLHPTQPPARQQTVSWTSNSDSFGEAPAWLSWCAPGTTGGRGEIRTRVRVSPKPDFESGAFNHSATLPLCLILLAKYEFWQSPNLRFLYWSSILFA